MSYYTLRDVSINEVDKIEALFEATYPERKLPLQYWKWLFHSPKGYVARGIFFNDQLVAYYSAFYHDATALCVSAMVHPDHRGKRLIQEVASSVYEEITKQVGFLHLFANKAIHPIYINQLGFIPNAPIIEYRKNIEQEEVTFIPFCTGNFNLDCFSHWRYMEHPTKQYYFHDLGTNFVVLNSHEKRTQIIDFDHWDILIYQVALAHAKRNDNTIIALWCEHEIQGFEKVELSTWHLHKKLNKFISHELLKELIPIKLRMGDSDVF